MLLALAVFLNFLAMAIVYFEIFSKEVSFYVVAFLILLIGFIVNFGFFRNLIRIIKGRKNND